MTTGVRHDDLRKRNREMVLAAVRRSGQPSRTEIAGQTGLSHSTISAIAADLIAEGVLTQLKGRGPGTLKRGRPQVSLGLEPTAATVVSIVLSLNWLQVSLIDYAGRTVEEASVRLRTQTASRQALEAAVVEAVGRLLETKYARHHPSLRMAMAVQGVTDAAGRALLWSPITRHGDIPFADLLEDAFDVPVTVENDCNMMAVALRERQPARFRDNLVTVLLSNGIGMGMILGGKLFKGSRSSGGEFGHMIHQPDGARCRCGRLGCIEAYAGNYAIMRRAHGQPGSARPEADIGEEAMLALAEKARAHDGPERHAFREAGRAIGYGLGSLFALVDPAPVALVGPGTAAFDIFEPAMREAIAATAGGQDAGAITFDIEFDERPLIREGCAFRALAFVDDEVFAPGGAGHVEPRDVA